MTRPLPSRRFVWTAHRDSGKNRREWQIRERLQSAGLCATLQGKERR